MKTNCDSLNKVQNSLLKITNIFLHFFGYFFAIFSLCCADHLRYLVIFLQPIDARIGKNSQDDREFQALSESVIAFSKIYGTENISRKQRKSGFFFVLVDQSVFHCFEVISNHMNF